MDGYGKPASDVGVPDICCFPSSFLYFESWEAVGGGLLDGVLDHWLQSDSALAVVIIGK